MTEIENRYAKHHIFPPIGTAGQGKLTSSRVAIVGIGALGGYLANILVRSGVGYIRLIDNDIVQLSNLQRQILFNEEDVKKETPKVFASKNRLALINSNITIEAFQVRLNKSNAEEYLSNVDLILDGSDNFDVRYIINDVSIKLNIPWIYAGVAGSLGMTHTIIPGKTPCLKCLFPEPPSIYNTANTSGIIAPIIQNITSYQATEALKLLVGDFENLRTTLLSIDLWKNDLNEINVKNARNPQCTVCEQHQFNYID